MSGRSRGEKKQSSRGLAGLFGRKQGGSGSRSSGRGGQRGTKNRSRGGGRTGKQTTMLKKEGTRNTTTTHNLPHGMTPIATPRREQETKEEATDNMTEQEIASNALPRGQDHFVDLPARFDFIRYLGHGSYGHVCEGRDNVTQDKVAIKKIMKIFDNDIDAKRLLRELRILRQLSDHENIVKLVDIVPPSADLQTWNSITLVFEFVDTDLAKLFQSDQFFTVLHVQYMLYQILLGLKYMHSANIAHRDLKPANILVNENCTLKICDFGLARGLTENEERPSPEAQGALPDLTPEEQKKQDRTAKKRIKGNVQRNMTKHVVTRWYRAPEVILLQQRRDTLLAIDMWSIGCIFAELLRMIAENCRDPTRRQPIFPGRSSFPLSANDPFAWADRSDQLNVIFDVLGTPSAEDIGKLQDEKARSYLTSLPPKQRVNFHHRDFFPGLRKVPEALDLLVGLLRFDVETRFTVDDALQHDFLRRVRDTDSEHSHGTARFEFEDVPVRLQLLQELVLDEICHYNPEFKEGLEDLKSQNAAQREAEEQEPDVDEE